MKVTLSIRKLKEQARFLVVETNTANVTPKTSKPFIRVTQDTHLVTQSPDEFESQVKVT